VLLLLLPAAGFGLAPWYGAFGRFLALLVLRCLLCGKFEFLLQSFGAVLYIRFRPAVQLTALIFEREACQKTFISELQ
jgi:hypothetical protein